MLRSDVEVLLGRTVPKNSRVGSRSSRQESTVPSGVLPWKLENFLERFDAWTELESPKDDLRCIVMAWVLTRYDDPYQGVRREPGFANLWFGAIPDSNDGAGNVVTCSYWIEESSRTVRCDNFGTLSLPL